MKQEAIVAKIKELQEEISQTPYHKGTEHHIGRLRAKIARLKDELVQKQTGGGGGGGGYAPGKSGDATVVLVGFPSAGKSTLLNALTAAHSKTAHYPFTTLQVIPGMMTCQGAKIQMLDVPGMIVGAASGRGRGKEILSVVRASDLALFIVDSQKPGQFSHMFQELEEAGLRLDKKSPKVTINKKDRGGIIIKNPAALENFSVATAKDIAQEFRLKNAEIIFGQTINQKEFIDVLSGSRVYLPQLLVINKADLLSDRKRAKLAAEYPEAIFVSAQEEQGLEKLRQAIYEKLALKRVFLKPEDGAVDYEEPMIVRGKTSVADLRSMLPEDVVEDKKAYLWGESAKFSGQLVSDLHQLKDKDIVCFR